MNEKEELELRRNEVASLLEDIDELEDEILDKDDQIETLESDIFGLRQEMQNGLNLECPICGGFVVQDVIEGLICQSCRRTFDLKEK